MLTFANQREIQSAPEDDGNLIRFADTWTKTKEIRNSEVITIYPLQKFVPNFKATNPIGVNTFGTKLVNLMVTQFENSCDRVPKSRPSTCSPWDLMIANGKRQIIF